MTDDKYPDIVHLVLAACKAEGFDAGIASTIERKICDQYGGRRVYIPKKNRLNEEAKKVIFADGLTGKTNKKITAERGISRATLYRLMKRG